MRSSSGYSAGSRAGRFVTAVRNGGFSFAVNTFAASPLVPRALRWLILRALGLDVPWNIAPRCLITGRDLTIGASSFINRECFFDCSAPIHIGERCSFGMGVMLVTSSHEVAGPDRRAGALTSAPIDIGDGCWLGSRAMVLPGVRIGDGVIVAAGAVVTEDCDADGLYAGVPARRVRSLDARTPATSGAPD